MKALNLSLTFFFTFSTAILAYGWEECRYVSTSVLYPNGNTLGPNTSNLPSNLKLEEVNGKLNLSISYSSEKILSGHNTILSGHNTSDEENIIVVEEDFGTRYSLFGTRGSIRFELNSQTGEAVLTKHIVPNLISDLQAPQAERTNIDHLTCQ